MSIVRRSAVLLLMLILLAASLSGCRTVPAEQYEALRDELESADREIGEKDARIATLEARVQTLQEALVRERDTVSSVESELGVALRQLGALREDRLDLRDDLDELERELERMRAAQTAVRRAEEAAAARGPGAPAPEPVDAMSAALAGRGTFTTARAIGFRNDERATARLSGSAPGIGVDTDSDPSVMYDTRLDYRQTTVYLTIDDPRGRRPRLRLTAQYTSDSQPLFLRTVVVTIEGGDPVDPVEPIVLGGEPTRQTDGIIIREALGVSVERALLDRLSTMISSSRFLVTFVGTDGQYTHRPSVAERAAMSNILFAFIDLGGVR